jgi:hypothetical protein
MKKKKCDSVEESPGEGTHIFYINSTKIIKIPIK